LKDSIDIYRRLITEVTTPIFITSDDKFSAEDLEYVKKSFANATVFIVDPNADLHLVHSLMRASSILVTSNSTFSWTAGMLNVREKPIIFSPTSFFGEAEHQSNDLFQTTSSWMVLDVD
ncbi:MAG: hypothetical protein ORN50_02555, partial [Crocinitomicaceae bacterium]|nr:hypothetical protein [Crocinitomicaceae bacterium]